jgi:hypothetical protein
VLKVDGTSQIENSLEIGNRAAFTTFVFVGRLHPAVNRNLAVSLVEDFVGALLSAGQILKNICFK